MTTSHKWLKGKEVGLCVYEWTCSECGMIAENYLPYDDKPSHFIDNGILKDLRKAPDCKNYIIKTIIE